MSGLQLSGMEMSDMLDVLHFLFEDDIISAQSGEHIDAKDKVRTLIYKEFYDRQYLMTKNGVPSVRSHYNFDLEDEIKPFNPQKQPDKPYVEPTKIDTTLEKPFGENIDAPLG